MDAARGWCTTSDTQQHHETSIKRPWSWRDGVKCLKLLWNDKDSYTSFCANMSGEDVMSDFYPVVLGTKWFKCLHESMTALGIQIISLQQKGFLIIQQHPRVRYWESSNKFWFADFLYYFLYDAMQSGCYCRYTFWLWSFDLAQSSIEWPVVWLSIKISSPVPVKHNDIIVQASSTYWVWQL